MNNNDNINISGLGTMSGGEFNDVSISGMGTISGDLKASCVQVSGNGVFRGDFVGKTLSVSGRAVFEKDVSGGKIEVSGSFECKGNYEAEKTSASGKIAVGGRAKGDKFRIYGLLSTEEGVEAEEFIINGSFNINGLLNSNMIDISIEGGCFAKEIGCEKISVKLGKIGNAFNKVMQFFFSTMSGKNIKDSRLVAECIEGNEIFLEYTEAAIVRGKVVTIGKGCSIGKIEYTESLRVDPDSKVSDSSRV